ncbi:hypothetical protein [Burkholderia phage FLC9]|nr:hypothetical protein [Burkholderia phage FLC9]
MKSQHQLSPFMSVGLALEMIDFQDNSFHEQLSGLFEELKKVGQRQMPESDAAKNIAQAIFDRTGIQIEFTMEEGGAYCMPPILDKNNPLLSNVWREYFQHTTALKMIKKAEDGLIRGTVNLVTSKVTGAFSEIKCVLNMPKSWVGGRFGGSEFTPGELSAITLHEVGHLFTGFEYLIHSVTTNQVLAGVARGLEESHDPNERMVILTTAANALKIDAEELKKLADGNGGMMATVKILQEVAKMAPSEIGTSVYDQNNWEQLADQFAARHGAQRDLITALDKVHRAFGDISVRSGGMFIAMEILKVIMMLGSVLLAIVAPAAAIVPFFVWMGLILFDSPGHESYDRPGVRLSRIRDQLVQQLKDRDISKELVERIKADLVVIDRLLLTVKDRFTLISAVFNFLSSERRDRFAQEKLARELEQLVANDLFVKSAELKTLY